MHALDAAPFTLRFPPPLTMTPDQFFDFCQANPDVRMEQAASGEVVILPSGFLGGETSMEVARQLANWAKLDRSGSARGPDTGFRLPNQATYAPDAAWIQKKRLAGLSREQLVRFLPLAPDFVIEVRSETDRLADQKAKMREYMDNGVRLGFLLDPPTKSVHVYRPGQEPVILVDPATVSAEPELPGFFLDLTDIW